MKQNMDSTQGRVKNKQEISYWFPQCLPYHRVGDIDIDSLTHKLINITTIIYPIDYCHYQDSRSPRQI